jgi:hypothetical protein
MSMPDRRPFATSVAAVMAGILTLSLVTPAPDMDVALLRAEVHDVQLTAATTAQISTMTVSPASRGTVAAAASTVAPTPAAATSGSANVVPWSTLIPEFVNNIPEFVRNVADTAAKVAIGAIVISGEAALTAAGLAGIVVLTPLWYLAAPITYPLVYANTTTFHICFGLDCQDNTPLPPATHDFAATMVFLALPLLAPIALIGAMGDLSNQVDSWLRSAFPALVQATAPSAAAPVTAKPVVNTLAAVATTVTRAKAPTRAAASILPTVAPKPTIAPKPLSFALQGGLMIGKPLLSQPGPLRTADTSTTSNLSKTVKHPVGVMSNTTQNATPRG